MTQLTTGDAGDGRAIEALLIALEQGPIEERWQAAEKLGDRHAISAVPALIRALQGNHWRTRSAAAIALGKIGDPRGEASLIAALGHVEVGTQIAAAQALGMIGNPTAVTALHQRIALERDSNVISALAQALALLGDSTGMVEGKQRLIDLRQQTRRAEHFARFRNFVVIGTALSIIGWGMLGIGNSIGPYLFSYLVSVLDAGYCMAGVGMICLLTGLIGLGITFARGNRQAQKDKAQIFPELVNNLSDSA